MCAADPVYKFEVKPERLAMAVALIREKSPRVSAEIGLNILMELGFGDVIKLNPQGFSKLEGISDLQVVAYAAALAAASEAGCKYTIRDNWRDGSPAIWSDPFTGELVLQ